MKEMFEMNKKNKQEVRDSYTRIENMQKFMDYMQESDVTEKLTPLIIKEKEKIRTIYEKNKK